MKVNVFLGVCLCSLMACVSPQNKNLMVAEQEKYPFSLEGHRGARGLQPENTIPAFKKAMDLGVNVLELDLAFTKDSQLLVSHDPFLNYQICLGPDGKPIARKDSFTYKIFNMTYAETQKCDCGSIGNPRFPEQEKQKAYKPKLVDMVAFCEAYMKEKGKTISYNIEIKTDPRADHIFTPSIETFSNKLASTLDALLPVDRVVIQCFDFRVLEYFHKNYPAYTLSALVETGDVKTNLRRLSFTPDIYSPHYTLLTKAQVDTLKSLHIAVDPWTVNDTTEMKKLLSWGVDGLITDYPNLALQYRSN